MYTQKCQTILRSNGTLLARIFMGGLFLAAGIQKLSGGISGIEGMIANIGLPAPLLVAWIVVLVEIVGGAAIIVGYYFREAAMALLIFTLLTILLVHSSFEDEMLLKNIAVMGGLLYMLAYGPGDGWKLGRQESVRQDMPTM